MFPSSGYFRNVFCPFYQHGLCHRPYCHFKHAKPVKTQQDEKIETVTKEKSPTIKHDNSRSNKVSAEAMLQEEDMMKIVKNISPSKLIEYAKRRQDEKELKHTLALIDKENKEKECSTRNLSTSSDGDLKSGLIDAFYNKSEISGNLLSDPQSLNDITPALNVSNRRICECDDPDCTGFIEDESTENITENHTQRDNADKVFADTADKYSSDESTAKVKLKKKKKKKLANIDFFSTDFSSNITTETNKDDKKITKDNKKKKRKKQTDTFMSNDNEKKHVKKAKIDVDNNVNSVAIDTEAKPSTSSKSNSNVAIKLKVNVAGVEDYIPDDCVVKTGQASLKKRAAHSNEEVFRAHIKSRATKPKKLSYISPGLAAPVATSQQTTATVPEVPASASFTTEHGVYVGKKRTSYVVSKPVTVTEKLKRPKLPMEIGGKIAYMLRQRYLDKIIDEYIPKCKSESSAIEKGFADEAVAYQRCTRKQIYLNLCANIIKKVRGLPDYKVPLVETDVSSMTQDSLQTVSRLKESTLAGYQRVVTEKKVVKNAIKAPSLNLINAALSEKKIMPNSSLKRRLSETVELTEENFYKHLNQYLLTDSQMWENKYPIRDANNADLALVKDYVPRPNLLKRLCCRCGKEYYMNAKGKYVTREECNYHWGKMRKKREKGSFSMFFSCCQSDGSGTPCSMGRLHVSDMVDPLDNFPSTDTCQNEDTKQKVFALDCEMCYTTHGLELTRLTVVGFHLEQIIDLFVKPTNPIVDYNTRFSGVTKEHLEGVNTSINDVHDILMNLFDKDTILMGHSLESDLKALKLIHRKVVDTALVFPHRLGLPFKRALRNLMSEHLQKIIQDGECGHDSCEDARSCMELMKYKFEQDNKKQNRVNAYQTSKFYKKN